MSEKRQEGLYQSAIRACVKNGCSLLDDAELMHGWDRYGTAYALTVVAEEEFSHPEALGYECPIICSPEELGGIDS